MKNQKNISFSLVFFTPCNLWFVDRMLNTIIYDISEKDIKNIEKTLVNIYFIVW